MPPAFNLSQDQTLQFDSVCLITLAGIEGSSDVAIGHSLFFHCVSTLSFEHAVTLRRETPRAGCALIKRPHLSAVSFLKSVAGFLAGAPLLQCNRSQAAKKRNYGAPQKACQASPPGQRMERSLDFSRTPDASTTCEGFCRTFEAGATTAPRFHSFRF